MFISLDLYFKKMIYTVTNSDDDVSDIHLGKSWYTLTLPS